MSVEKDVVFNKVGDRELKLDIYRPEAAANQTAILLMHGGGWAFGQRGMMEAQALQLAAKGFVVLGVEYRLLGEAPWPAQLDDVLAAVRWTQDNADRLGVRLDRIVAAGNSAGGHLALMAAAKLGKSKVGAVIANFAISELVAEPPSEMSLLNAGRLLGAKPTDEAARAISPSHQITADFPPVFLLHGGADWALDPMDSVRMYQGLAKLGVPTELHIVASAHHGFVDEPAMVGAMTSEMALFLNRTLIDPERWAADSQAANFFAKGPPPTQA